MNVYEKVRRRYSMNQTQFWGRLGVCQSAGSRYEAGRPPPEPVQILFNLIYVLPTTEAGRELNRLRNREFT